MTIYTDSIDTPLGKMEIEATKEAVLSIHFVERTRPPHANHVTDRTKAQLLEYFAGDRQQFDLPLAPQGTKFQQGVWKALLKIEYGITCSYRDIAMEINNPKAVRAVGSANGKNPLTIVVPCHRVIGSNGRLTGYASGTDRKAWLLNHEAQSLF